MTPQETEDLYNKYVLGNYPQAPLTLVQGRGVRVWDDKGGEYLDFTSGIGVNALGHAHPFWARQIGEQAARLAHTSNLFRNELQGRLAAVLAGKVKQPGKVFFCNSGVEANEALLKLSRRHGVRKSGAEGKCFKILCARKAFHGRSLGCVSATPQEKIQQGFSPLLPGFTFGELNNLDSFAQLVDAETAAILVETVQGEGGIHLCEPEFLQGLRELCDRHNLLLLIDEVQCGMGRTGTFFAYEESGIVPDAIGMAKGLGGGFPIGAMWVREEHAELLPPGSHGTTFGGSPLACAAGLATLTVIEREGLLAKVRQQGPHFFRLLEQVRRDNPDKIVAVRGRGHMMGVQLNMDPAPVIAEMRELGLLTVGAGGNVIRFLPPLVASTGDLEKAGRIFRSALAILHLHPK